MDRMSRRMLAAGLAALAIPGCRGQHEQENAHGVLYGRAVSVTPPQSPWDDQWSYFRERLAAEPTIRLEYFNRGETGGEEQQMFDLRRGRAMLAGLSLQGLSSIVPELTIAMAPFVFQSEAEVDYVYDRHLFEVFRPLFRAKGLHLMQWVEVGWTNLYSNGPVRTPHDAAGRKLRGSPNRAAQVFLRAIGADSVPLASTEIVPALQTGLVSGGLGGTVFHFFSTRDYASDFTLTRHSYDTGAIVANASWLGHATPRQRQTLESAWMSSVQARASVRNLTRFAIAQMKQRGIRIHELTPAERALWVEACGGVVELLVREIGGSAQEVFDAIEAGRTEYAMRGRA